MAIVKDVDITPEQRQLVCSIFATHLPDTEVWAYGSRVHWNATPSSDLDLVAFSSDKSGLANCRDAFAESSLPFRVDLFLWDEIPENFQDRIKQEYAVLMPQQEVKWKYIPMRVFCTRVADGTHATPKPVNAGKKLVTSKNIVKGKLSLEDCYCISQDDFDEINRRSKVDLGDVLLSMIGTVGATCVIEIEPDFAIKNVALLKNKDLLHGKYLNYYLSTSEGQLLIRERLRGTTQQYIPLEDVRNLPIKVPCNPDEMKEIVNFLSAFDDKIELNRQMSKTLEAVAEALFKSWFVDFEPVRAKISAIENGKDPEFAAMVSISGKTEVQLAEMKTSRPTAYAELAHAASLFPSVMVESEQGKIPEGWQAVQLKDVTTQITARNGEKKCKVLSAVSSGELVLSEEHFNKQVFSKETNKYILVEPNAYAYNPSRINIGSLGRNKFDFVGCVSPIYVVFSVAEEYISFFDQFFASQTFKDEVLLRASGSVRQALNYSDFGQIELQYPPLSIMQAFNEKIDIILQKLSALSAEIQTLSNLWDNHLTEFFSLSEENEL